MRLRRGLARRRAVCVLASGGMDSVALVADMLRRGREVHPLYVRCGLRWEKAELHWLSRALKALAGPRLKPLAVIDSPVAGLWGRHWSLGGRGVPSDRSGWKSVRLPGRNVLLLSAAGVFCSRRDVPEIVFGILRGNPFPDATSVFLRRMEAALRAGLGFPVRIRAPYRRLGKAGLARRAAGAPLGLSFSCLRPKGRAHCGRCNKCAERRLVLPW